MSSNYYEQCYRNLTDYINEMQNISQKAYEEYVKIFEDPQNIWEKANESYKAYNGIYKLWEKLYTKPANLDFKNINEVYDEWQTQYTDYIKKVFASFLPDNFKSITTISIETLESYRNAMNTLWKPWLDSFDSVKDIFGDAMMNDPQAYLDFLELWQNNYEESFSKLIKSPAFGKDRELLEKQKVSMDKYVRYSIAVSKFNITVYKIGQETTKKVMEEYINMLSDNSQPKTYEEFYTYWAKQINSAYEELFLSDDFSRLVGHMINAMSQFKLEYDRLIEAYLAELPVPKKSEMDSLFKTIYDIKKELKSLRSKNTPKEDIQVAEESESSSKASVKK